MKAPFAAQLGQSIVAAPVAGAYSISDDDNGCVIELTGTCTIGIPATLTGRFVACLLMQMDTATSSIVPATGVSLVSDSGLNATAAGAQYAMYELRRMLDGTVLLRSGA